MSGETISPNMSLPIPGVGQTGSPTWASDLNASLTIVDSHNHAAGAGVPITPDGLNISADLPMNGNNLITARSLRMTPQSAVLANAADLGCLSVVGVDLYFNDVSGNKIQITQSGGIAGSPGSISNLTSPASAAYVAANTKFVWQSAANTPADMDGGSLIVRNLTANSKGLTLSAPAAMGADYTVTLPSLPASTKILTIDTSGNIGSTYAVDNSTIEVSSSVIQVKNAGITQAKRAIRALGTTVAAGGIASSASTGTFSDNKTTYTAITNAACTITTLGNPVEIRVVPDGTINLSFMGLLRGAGQVTLSLRLIRSGTEIASWFLSADSANLSPGIAWPISSIYHLDRGPTNSGLPAATYAYSLEYKVSNAAIAFAFQYANLTAQEVG